MINVASYSYVAVYDVYMQLRNIIMCMMSLLIK